MIQFHSSDYVTLDGKRDFIHTVKVPNQLTLT